MMEIGERNHHAHVVIAEPQCAGFEHATFNAALVRMALEAFPEAKATYWGEREHLEWVRRAAIRHGAGFGDRIAWREKDVPPALLDGWRRFALEWKWHADLLREARKSAAQLLIVASVTRAGWLALKLLLYLERPPFPVLVVPHSVLRSLLSPRPRKPWRRVFHLPFILALPHPRRLGYVALGEPVYRALQACRPSRSAHFTALGPAYLFAEAEIPGEKTPEPVRFGYFGVGAKGFETFAGLASEISPRSAQIEFHMVGFLNASVDRTLYEGRVSGVSNSPLTPEEFDQRARGITYAVWTAGPEQYTLAASASFLDAMSYAKPCIALRNPFLEYYFEQMGDIGYLCGSVDEIKGVVAEIAARFPAARYRRQCSNILAGRRLFDPALLAPRLRAIVDGGAAGSVGSGNRPV